MAEPELTLPTACGLAIALPMSLADVQAALRGGAYGDYIGRSALIGSAEALWQSGLAKVATALEVLAERAASLGVKVVLHAQSSDLATLFNGCRVVTVVAHWRGPEVTPRDLKLDPVQIAQRVADDVSETATLLRRSLRPDWRRSIETAPDRRSQASRLAELVDLRLCELPALAQPPAGSKWHMDPATLRHFNRACLDAWWPEGFVAGNRLELADGLHDAGTIGKLINPQWSGVADFSSCQSTQLVDEIKQGRSDRVVVANDRETNPLLRIAVLQVVYDLLAEARRNYAEVRWAVAKQLTIGETANR